MDIITIIMATPITTPAITTNTRRGKPGGKTTGLFL
jgi:hypothetical protein